MNPGLCDVVSSLRDLCTRRRRRYEPRVPHGLDLLLRLALGPMISLAPRPLRILPLQQRIIQHAPPQQKENQIRKHDAVPRPILGFILVSVNIAADNAVQIPPPDDEPHGDAALVHALGVVADPGDGVGDARVDAEGAEEGARVLDAGGGAGEEHGEADDAEDGDAHVAEAAALGAVRGVADHDGEDGGGGVGGDGQELGFGAGVAELDCL